MRRGSRKEEDINICKIVLNYALDCIDNTVKKLKAEKRKAKLSVAGLENDYANGFIRGLNRQFQEQKEKNKEWAIVLQNDSDINDMLKKLNIKKSVNMESPFKGHNKAYQQGEMDGNQFDISNKVKGEDNAKELVQ